MLDRLFAALTAHEEKLNSSFSFIPSENMLSPLARAPFLSDAFSRYFFDEEKSGRWTFQGGSIAGRIQNEVVIPLLRQVGGARFVDLHPISGLTAMTVALTAFGGSGDVISIAPRHGGHPATRYIAELLGHQVHDMPFDRWSEPDQEGLGQLVERTKPSLVYIDHPTALVPLDLQETVRTIRDAAPGNVHVHVDSSHVNGLIWGRQLPNPLSCGADSYGGSTHKTFPGPHKAVLFSNDAGIAERTSMVAGTMVSHHHLASVVALGISLIEFVTCGGERYAAQILRNAQAFAMTLAAEGVWVEGPPPAFTATHQVWTDAPEHSNAYDTAARMFQHGLVVNAYNPLPSLGREGIRLGLNEPTRLGLMETDVQFLAHAFAKVWHATGLDARLAHQVAEFRRRCQPAYCVEPDAAAEVLGRFAATLRDGRSIYLEAPRAATRGSSASWAP